MQKIHFSIQINAPREKVWDVMLGDKTYREWTKAFSPGGYYKGDWNEGSKILFMGIDPKTGIEGGMVSRIKESRKPERVSIEHLGFINNGVEDTTSEEARKWAPAFEDYTFTEKDGGTRLGIDVDIVDEMKEEFEGMWPNALEILKEIAER